LCARLDLGGVSPPAELVRAALAATSLPLAVMVRPRPGDFVYARAEIETMLAELARLRGAGAAIAVLGALTPRPRRRPGGPARAHRRGAADGGYLPPRRSTRCPTRSRRSRSSSSSASSAC
jgi:hypothetical protein